MKTMILPLFTILFAVAAQAATPPAQIERQSYDQWLSQIGAPASPYTDYAFRWIDAQKGKGLPNQVNADPEKLYVTVEAPLAEAVRAESAGEVEEATSYGLETYALINAPVDTVLETILFRWGKPVGKTSGITHPIDTVYGFREESLKPEFGPGSYKTTTVKKNGGIAGDMADSFVLLSRGSAKDGYTLIGSFLAPTGETISTSFITVITLKPTADGKTEYRVAGLLNAQSYAFFGVEQGRKNFGFNLQRIRE
ncbi:MAG TPA: hypothetical protein VIH99_04575, partial [Bdellovibrionota bacterium]